MKIMNIRIKPILVFIACMSILGILVMLSGIVPIGASGGHWKITEWILSFSMKRSISTHSLGIKPPSDLHDQARILRGAGHFEINCRHCHGTPGNKSLVGQLTTPQAPYLTYEIPKWGPAELFLIVKEGVKFTGMPAWAALEREDEIWDMVAFLQRLPHLSGPEYRNLARGPACHHCHGKDGNGRGVGAFPKLAGQNREYLENSLHAYKWGKRHSGTMEMVASRLDEETIKELARHFSGKKRKHMNPAIRQTDDEEAIARGKALAHQGIPGQKVAACIGCHGNGGKGHFPLLDGQYSSYLINQLRLFKQDKRGGTEYSVLMKKSFHRLSEEQMRDVSLYYESLH